MTTETLNRIAELSERTECDADSLRFLQHVFEGYRDAVLDSDPLCPHVGSTQAAEAWETGRRMAFADLGRRD